MSRPLVLVGVVVVALATGERATATLAQHGSRTNGEKSHVVAGGGITALPASSEPPREKGNVRPALPPPVIPRGGGLFDLLFRNPEVLLGVRQSQSRSAETALQRAAATLLSRRVGIWLVRSRNAAPLIAVLDRLGLLTFVEPNRRFATFRYSDPLAQPAYSWHLYAVGADLETPPGPGFPLTIIDGGFDPTNLDFAGRPDTVVVRVGETPQPGEEPHETWVAATAAAATNGVGGEGLYPQARLRIFDVASLTEANIVSAFDAAINAGPSVINLSWGSPDFSWAIYQEIIAAFGTGSLVVASAGNSFDEGNPILYPASQPHVLTAAATDEQNAPAFFSSSNFAVDMAAPGVDIPIAVDPTQYLAVDGTSFSAPMVSAAAAWIQTVRRLQVTQLFDQLRWETRDIGEQGYDERTGYGLLNVSAALHNAAPPIDPQEPNDDINQIVANGIFKQSTPPINRPTDRLRRLTARLDVTEDPDDVYNVLVGPQRELQLTVAANTDVVLELWGSRARTVWTGKGGLIARSDNPGNTETVSWSNRTRRTQKLYAHVNISKGADRGAAAYTLTVRTT
jgi:Subtilase family